MKFPNEEFYNSNLKSAEIVDDIALNNLIDCEEEKPLIGASALPLLSRL